jgi:hypothetical protein
MKGNNSNTFYSERSRNVGKQKEKFAFYTVIFICVKANPEDGCLLGCCAV